MADRHKRAPVSVRFSDDDMAWLEAEAKRQGVSVHWLIVECVGIIRMESEYGWKLSRKLRSFGQGLPIYRKPRIPSPGTAGELAIRERHPRPQL